MAAHSTTHARADSPPPGSQTGGTTVDDREIAGFDALAGKWWDTEGEFAPLHRLNPVRLAYIRDRLVAHFGLEPASLRPLVGLRIVDVGCGGGLLSEPLARMGASVTAIDAGHENIAAARRHAETMGLEIDYRQTTAEELAAAGARFDALVSMEVLEHVADLGLFVGACAELVRPGGALALATLNRTLKSYAMAIVGAEYVLRWLPRGTHRWDRFVRPSELARHLRANGATLQDLTGVTYDPLSDRWQASRDTDVNYMAFAVRD
jgi:2-polyprenyl-6-hydroxyphenyl methylase/3-demethylubiquinone-9 3-methyltransferase